MTTRAKRDKKKANRAAKKAREAVAALLDSPVTTDPVTKESEHAAALTALAAAKRFKKKLEGLCPPQ